MTAAAPLQFVAPPVALPDDSLKDADCLGFIDAFDPAERRLWLDWARALRLADRLAENDSGGFGHFRASWGIVQSLGLSQDTPRARAWSAYLDALATYGDGYVVRTIAEHDEMLMRLSGPLLQLAPHMPEELWEAAGHFGALDQFYNNMRDLQEDAERGMCWLPTDVLLEHGLTRDEVISGRAPEMRGWQEFMQYWLVVERTRLFSNSVGFDWAPGMHPSIAAMCSWTKRRYRRIADALDAVDYDYRRFPARYWPEVRRELAGQGDATVEVTR